MACLRSNSLPLLSLLTAMCLCNGTLLCACSIACHEYIILDIGEGAAPSGIEYYPSHAIDNILTFEPDPDPMVDTNSSFQSRDLYDTYTVCVTADPAQGFDAGGGAGPWVMIEGRRICAKIL